MGCSHRLDGEECFRCSVDRLTKERKRAKGLIRIKKSYNRKMATGYIIPPDSQKFERSEQVLGPSNEVSDGPLPGEEMAKVYELGEGPCAIMSSTDLGPSVGPCPMVARCQERAKDKLSTLCSGCKAVLEDG